MVGNDYFVKLQILSFQPLLNFTYILKKPFDGSWGTLKENGRWSGMIGILQRNEANFGKQEIVNITRLLYIFSKVFPICNS